MLNNPNAELGTALEELKSPSLESIEEGAQGKEEEAASSSTAGSPRNVFSGPSVSLTPEAEEENVFTSPSKKRGREDEKGVKEEARKTPRVRSYHSLSEGESESEDPNVIWRSLRPEENPFEEGLKPPVGHDPNKTAAAHISAGSKAREKSAWVSGTRSRKVAGAWATEAGGYKRVAKFRISEEKRGERVSLGGVESRRVYDLTDPDQAREVFPSGTGTALNTAKASQEVVIYKGVEAEDVENVFNAKKISVKEYNQLKEERATREQSGDKVQYQGEEVYALFRTRARATDKPLPRVLTQVSKPT